MIDVFSSHPETRFDHRQYEQAKGYPEPEVIDIHQLWFGQDGYSSVKHLLLSAGDLAENDFEGLRSFPLTDENILNSKLRCPVSATYETGISALPEFHKPT